MDPAVQPWLDLWDYLDGNFWSVWEWAKADLSPDEVGWQPTERVASVGWNLRHLAEMLDHYLTRVFDRGPQVSAGPLVTMRRASQDDGRFRDLAAIAAYHRRVRPAYREFLTDLTLADLGRELAAGSRHTWSWAVGHIAEHESYHLGKVTLLKSLLEARRGR